MNDDISADDYDAMVANLADEVYAAIGEYLRNHGKNIEPHLREVTGAYLEHRGKCIRPALVTFACLAADGDRKDAIQAAAAAEMFHTWTLMHDDIIDHDNFRRGRPTAHVRGATLGQRDLALQPDTAAEYGTDLAILAGDLLHGLAADMLMSTTHAAPDIILELSRRMCFKLTAELLTGEQLDVRLSLTPWCDVTEHAIMQMMRLKTGALLAFCSETGAAIAENRTPDSSPTARALADFAHLCGLAFQMKDDLLGVFGDASQFGKPIGSDLREDKRTVLILRTLRNATPAERTRMHSILGKKDADDTAIADARTIIRGTGAEREVTELSNDCVNKALAILQNSFRENDAAILLRHWALNMLARSK